MDWSRREVLRLAALGAAGIAMAPKSILASLAQDGFLLDWKTHDRGDGLLLLTSTSQSSGGNVLIVKSNHDVLVVDTKFPAFGAVIARDASIDSTGERILINTHHHADHTGGNASFANGWKRLAHHRAISRIQSQVAKYTDMAATSGDMLKQSGSSPEFATIAQQVADAAPNLGPKDFTPETSIPDSGTMFNVGDVHIRVSHFGPGHTDNDVVVFLPKQNIVHAGDLVFDGINPFFDQSAGASAMGWIQSLQSVKDLCDNDTIVVSGHGQVGDLGLIDTQMSYFEQLVKAVRSGIASGNSKEELTEKTFPFMEGLGFDQGRKTCIAGTYDELIAR